MLPRGLGPEIRLKTPVRDPQPVYKIGLLEIIGNFLEQSYGALLILSKSWYQFVADPPSAA